MQVYIPTIGIEKFFKYHSEIRMRTIDVALSADLNDRERFSWNYYKKILLTVSHRAGKTRLQVQARQTGDVV